MVGYAGGLALPAVPLTMMIRFYGAFEKVRAAELGRRESPLPWSSRLGGL
jgi:hypothetical protein